MTNKITREEFIAYLNAQAAAGDGPTVDELEALGFAIVPCDCDYERCQGWKIQHAGLARAVYDYAQAAARVAQIVAEATDAETVTPEDDGSR